MSKLDIEFYSQSLNRPVSFKVFIPNDRCENPKSTAEMKVLFFLHGYTDAANSWGCEELARKHNFIAVMPSGENSFYLDGEGTGRKYCQLVGKEIPDMVERTFGVKVDADNACIMGISMGGFGALHTALAFPERFGKAAALSPALIVHEIEGMKEGEDNGVADYYYYRSCFGNLEDVTKRDVNPEMLAKALHDSSERMPEIFICCGTEDFLIENNRQMHRFLEGEKIPHEYIEDTGIHDGVFWDKYMPIAIEWLFG